MFIRLQTYRVDGRSHRPQGVFVASYELLEGSFIEPWFEEEIVTLWRWFSRYLPIPPRRAFESDRAICWFRQGAEAYVRRLWSLVAFLEEAGAPVEIVTIRQPGLITYEDHAQVVAIPHRRWRP